MSALAKRVSGVEGEQLLRGSVVAHRAALEVRTRKDLALPWAETQKNLGISLHDLGRRIGGTEGNEFLRDAVAAYQNALEIFTEEEFSDEWKKINYDIKRILTRLEGEK